MAEGEEADEAGAAAVVEHAVALDQRVGERLEQREVERVEVHRRRREQPQLDVAAAEAHRLFGAAARLVARRLGRRRQPRDAVEGGAQLGVAQRAQLALAAGVGVEVPRAAARRALPRVHHHLARERAALELRAHRVGELARRVAAAAEREADEAVGEAHAGGGVHGGRRLRLGAHLAAQRAEHAAGRSAPPGSACA